jgi:hypothetical protein
MNVMPIRRRRHSYDPKCYELAESYLADHPDCRTLAPKEFASTVAELAEDIQATIENFEPPKDHARG